MDAGRANSPEPGPLDVAARRFSRGRWQDLTEVAVCEERVRVLHERGASDLWAWPHDLEDLAVGHVLLDCAPFAPDSGADACHPPHALPVPLRAGRAERVPAPAACHCLRVDFSHKQGVRAPADPGPQAGPRLSAATLQAAMRDFFAAPGHWDGTGSFHRAGLFCPAENRLIRVAEDIGRHNCLDRLAGFCARQGLSPGAHLLCLSARITGSLYAKARRAGFVLLASRGAVTGAALLMARAQGVSLAAFCRPQEERLTVFCDAAGRICP